MPTLIVRPKDYEPFTIKVEKLRMTIGRSSRNDICISDPFASRLHAEVRLEGDQLVLVDMGSANGTYLNARRVTGSVRLNPLDLIRIGETEIEYQSDAQTTQSTPTVFLSGSAVQALPADTITTTLGNRTTSDLMSSIQSASGMSGSKSPAAAISLGQAATQLGMAKPATPRMDLLGIVSMVGVALLPNTSVEESLNRTIDMVFEAIPAERGFLFLKEKGELQCKVARKAGDQALPADLQVQISRSISNKVLTEGASVLTSDAAHDPRFQAQHSIVLSQIRSVMAVPLFSGEATFGMIYVDNPLNNRFTEEDLKVLTTIASVASIKIEHQQLLEERLEKRRMEEELKVASEIQLRLQPVAPPKVDGYDMTGVSFPCREIGGDYYDFVQSRKDSQLAIALGDVSGKGTGAALLMSSLHAAVRAQSLTTSSIHEIMDEINRYLYENTPPNKYATLFYGKLDPKTGLLTYSNGGHNPPMLIRKNGTDVLRLDIGGRPVGMMPSGAYCEGQVEFFPGDVLVIYSDGISESVNEANEEFGEERLLEAVQKNVGRSAAGIRDRIDEALSKFVGNTPPFDDMTLMVVKRVMT
ncbi:MAG TPA: SpoIIE family protein phosphatase [Blastocatellia bacterium]|nr:SpoIIE family protein phosphatase [Blastocatellia bacterium]